MSFPSDSLLVCSLNSKNSLIGVGSTPGKGIQAPTLAINSRAKEKKIFCRSSGIFKEFVKNSLFKKDFKEFKIPDGIYLTSLNYDTGLKSSLNDKNTIIEALKREDINNIDNNNLISINDRDTLVKFRQFY